MSKFWFFDRKGRPTINEKKLCDKFNSLMNEGTVSRNQLEEYIEQYKKPMNENELEEMFGYLTGKDSSGNEYVYADDGINDYNEESDYEESEVDDEQTYESENVSGSTNKDAIDFNPFAKPVIERSYTLGFQPPKSEDDDSGDDDGDGQGGFSDEELKMPSDGEDIDELEDEDIPEPDWASSSDESEEDEDEDGYDDEDGGDKLGGDNLQDLSPAQKRKSAEKTADALLSMYCQFVPMPFVKWSSFSEGKIQKMVFENKIDLQMQLENNVSVKDYIDSVNEQAQEVFKVTDETKEEIKDPLVDVLLEQDLALTPTQRLMLAVGGHLVTMGFSAFQLAQNNKQALEAFEKFHIQMNKQTAPAFQEKAQPKKRERVRDEDVLSRPEKEAVEDLMRQMDADYNDDDDVLDAHNDPSIEISEDYDDED